MVNVTPNLNIVSRKEWGADASADTHPIPLMPPVTYVLRTFTDTEPCHSKGECMKAIRELQNLHVTQGQSDIKYNFVIGGDGTVYEGRGWQYQPYLNYNYPEQLENCIEIAHFGYSGMPSLSVMSSTENLVALGVEMNYIAKKFKVFICFEEMEEPNDSECQKDHPDPDTLFKDKGKRRFSFV